MEMIFCLSVRKIYIYGSGIKRDMQERHWNMEEIFEKMKTKESFAKQIVAFPMKCFWRKMTKYACIFLKSFF